MTASVVDYAAKRRRTIVTPEGIALPFTVATRSARFAALVIDFVILVVGTIGMTVLLAKLAGGIDAVGRAGRATGAGEFLGVIWMLAWFLTWNGYFIAFELSPRGATPGKRLARIRVAARPHDGGGADGAGGGAGGGTSARLTAEAVIARNLLRDIELFMPIMFFAIAPTGETWAAGIAAMAWFAVFAFMPLFNRDGLRAGDLIAGTWVVESPRAALPETLSTAGAAAGASVVTGAKYRFGEAELAVYGEYELQTLERVLREDRAEAIVSVQEAICRKIGWSPGAGDERAFLEAYYAQLRARLEGGMRFGKRKADKFSAS